MFRMRSPGGLIVATAPAVRSCVSHALVLQRLGDLVAGWRDRRWWPASCTARRRRSSASCRAGSCPSASWAGASTTVAGLEGGHRADALAHQLRRTSLHDLVGAAGRRRPSAPGSRSGTWPFSSSATPITAHSATSGWAASTSSMRAGREPVAGDVDDVVGAGHDVDVAVLVDEAGIGGLVVAGKVVEIARRKRSSAFHSVGRQPGGSGSLTDDRADLARRRPACPRRRARARPSPAPARSASRASPAAARGPGSWPAIGQPVSVCHQ